jgi:hypothetical protein
MASRLAVFACTHACGGDTSSFAGAEVILPYMQILAVHGNYFTIDFIKMDFVH